MMNYWAKRFKEPSTLLGLLAIACMFSKQIFNVDLTPEQIAGIKDFSVILAGGGAIAAKDHHENGEGL